MSANVWRGVGDDIGDTGAGAILTLPYQETESAPFCSTTGSVITFSSGGFYHVAVTASCVNSSGAPDYLDYWALYGTSGSPEWQVNCRHHESFNNGGWAFGNCLMFVHQFLVGDTLTIQGRISGGSNGQHINDWGETRGTQMVIGKLS